jgi:hypothetical protein
VDLPYEPPEITASLAVDKEDNLDFVTFQDTFINPDQEHDSHVNRLLDRVKTWYVLDDEEKEAIIAGTHFDADRLCEGWSHQDMGFL